VSKTVSAKQKAKKKRRGLTPEFAFYYPGPMWRFSDYIKTLLLFFDGVALLVPEYMRKRPEEIEPFLATPLKKAGLLRILEPESLVDRSAARELGASLAPILRSDALRKLTKGKTAFHELSLSRLGAYGDPEIAESIINELKSQGLARESEDGVSIPMHPMVRNLILVLLAQILRSKGEEIGVELSPATDWPQVAEALAEVLSLPVMPSAGRVVSFDLETVAPDLTKVPLDEVLDFRKEHLTDYRAYARAVRKFVRELSLMDAKERGKAFADRQDELRDLASALKKHGRKIWGKPAAFALSAAGAAWTYKTGDLIGGLLAGGAAVAAAAAEKSHEGGAYTYLFSAHQRFG
jgi:hypothetical protein